jgi:DNA-binding transcriptional ArsR family regulator
VIRIVFPSDERVPVRVVVSPFLNAVVGALELFLDVDRVWSRRWQQLVRERSRGLDLGPLDVLRTAPEVPDALAPVPRPPGSSFEEELARVRATPPETVAADVAAAYGGAVDGLARRYLDEPAAALADYCDALALFWSRVFLPSWPRLRSLLEREALVLGWMLTTRGLSSAAARLNRRVHVTSDALALDVPEEREVALGGRVVVLSPLVVGDRRLLWNVDQSESVTLAYKAPGVLALWEGGELPVDARLASVVGRPRARRRSALAPPLTVPDLAETLVLARGSVAPQLTTLAGAGLVTRSRVGRRVYYQLSSAGVELLGLLASGDRGAADPGA